MGNVKIRTRLLLIFITISVVPILLLGSISFYRARTMLQDQAMNTLVSTMEQIEINLESNTERVNRSLRTLASSTTMAEAMRIEYTDVYVLKDALDEFIHPVLILTLGQNSDYSDIFLYTSRNFPAYSQFVIPISEIEEMGDRVKPAIDSNNPHWYFEKDHIYASQRNLILTTANRTDIITLEIDTEQFYQKLVYPDGNTLLLDEGGNIIFSECSCPIDGIGEIMEPITEAGGYVTIDGERYMAIRGGIDMPRLTFYYFVPVKSVVVDSDNILSTTLIFAIAMCVCSLLISIWFSGKLSKALSGLIEAFDVVENGSFEVNVDNDCQDEIGVLSRRFMHMMKWLKDEIDENNQAHNKVREAELRALQAQINPHFLFNTISMINWKALERGANDLSKIAISMGVFYRTALSKGADVVPLKVELANVQAYLEIRQFMCNGDFDVEYDIDESVMECKVIKLILQPIVENAIDHGINGMKERRGKLTIRIRRNENMVDIMVIDNGKGMTEEMAKLILSENTTGYGLKNVNDRLQYYFGDEGCLKIDTAVGIGTAISIEGIYIEK